MKENTIAGAMDCVSSQGKDMNDNDIYYKKCIKKYGVPLEIVRHGANPNKKSPEIIQNVIKQKDINEKGKNMNKAFRHRLVEEAFSDFGQKLKAGFGTAYDRAKDFAGNNPGVAAGLGGAAAGALTNYLTGGAEDLQLKREAELDAFNKTELPDMIRSSRSLSPDEFNNYYDAYSDMEDTNPITSFLGDKLPFTDNSFDNADTMTQIRLKNPQAFENIKDPMVERENFGKLGNFKLNPENSQENNWEAYQKYLKNNIVPDENEKETFLKNNSEANIEKVDLERGIKNATRDSYLKGAGLGAALGSGGVFAKRKLDERKNNY